MREILIILIRYMLIFIENLPYVDEVDKIRLNNDFCKYVKMLFLKVFESG